MPDTAMLDGQLLADEKLHSYTKELKDNIQKLGLMVKHHEDNLKFLKTQIKKVDESILDMQVDLDKYHSLREIEEKSKGVSIVSSEEETIQQILVLENTAAGIICQMKVHHGLQASTLPLLEDVLGTVATLGKVETDNLSRLFSEFLGLETMIAIVCKTHEGVKALEKYEKMDMIDKSSGVHGLGLSLGRIVEGRFHVFCLENLRPYVGKILPGDPERRLALLQPRLPSGECPPGFCGFAVNMISIDRMHLSCLTTSGQGLRETLFYNLFSHVQVYETRAHMHDALPCISDGAISLDGGIMRSSGLFFLSDRNHIDVKFPVSSGASNPPLEVIEMKEQTKLMKWKKERLVEDVQREEVLLNQAKESFIGKRNELVALLRCGNSNPI